MKKIILLVVISLFMYNISFSSEGCSAYKKLSKDYLKCLGGKIKNKTSNIGLDTEDVKEKKYLTDWFKKKK
jgi:hypothetical protein